MNEEIRKLFNNPERLRLTRTRDFLIELKRKLQIEDGIKFENEIVKLTNEIKELNLEIMPYEIERLKKQDEIHQEKLKKMENGIMKIIKFERSCK